MKKKEKLSFEEQEQIYNEQLKIAKNKLDKFRTKRALEIGQLALKEGLGSLSDEVLVNWFSKAKKAEEK